MSAARIPGYVLALRWLTRGDDRVCPRCAPRDQRLYPATLADRPPLHPACRCMVIPELVPESRLTPAERIAHALPLAGGGEDDPRRHNP